MPFLLAVAHALALPPTASSKCELTTPLGRLRGAASTDFCSYRAIPYAKPPIGDLRWRPPQPAGAWAPRVLDATRFPSTCMQNPFGGWNTIQNRENRSEDCLYLNVVAPRAPQRLGSDGLRPVIVYLHAGEFDYGASSDRESDYAFFARDAVLVAPNSRLGAFGFLASDVLRSRSPDGSTGNYGIQDQRLAMQWVQANVKAFGGDPNNVVLMGESSGGTSVSVHLTAPSSWGLFHRVILESPGLTQTKRLADAELNHQFLLSALLSEQSPACKRASRTPSPPPSPGVVASSDASKPAFHATARELGAYVRFAGTIMPDEWNNRSTKVGGGIGWSVEDAGKACDTMPHCHSFTVHERRSLNRTTTEVVLHNTSFLFPLYGGVPQNETYTSYLKQAEGGAQGVECLRRASADRLTLYADLVPRGDTFETDAWAPVIDGVEQVGTVTERIVQGHTAPNVAVLSGSNLDEGTIFMYLTPHIRCEDDEAALRRWSEEFYGPKLGALIPPAYQTLRQPIPKCKDWKPPAQLHAEPRSARRQRVHLSRRTAATPMHLQSHPSSAQRSVSVTVGDGIASGVAPGRPNGVPMMASEHYMAAMRSAGDYAITCRVRQAAQALQRSGHRVYTYLFAHTPSFSENYEDLPYLGAFHGAEVPFVFGDQFELKTDGERSLSASMGCYWRNFVHTGNPNQPPVAYGGRDGASAPDARLSSNASGCGSLPLAAWPSFVPGDDEQTMVLDIGTVAPEKGLKIQQCDLFFPPPTPS